MSHIHLPDGVLPFYWWAAGMAASFIITLVVLKRLKPEDVRRRIPFVGILAAFMLITMSVPLGIIPVHLSLAVLCGILAGPGLGFLAVVVVNVMLAFFGHGGITVVGINTLILGSEAVIGSYLYRILCGRIRNTAAAVLSVAASLLVSTALMVVIVGSTAGIAEALPHSGGHSEEAHMETGTETGEAPVTDESEPNVGDEAKAHIGVDSLRYLLFSGWGALFAIYIAGIAVEAAATALVVNFFLKVRPDLVMGSKGLTSSGN